MGGDLSETSIVRIVVIGLHVSSLGNTSEEKEGSDSDIDSPVISSEHDVPLLVVDLMDLLKSCKVSFSHWSVG